MNFNLFLLVCLLSKLNMQSYLDELGCDEKGIEYNGEQCIFTSAAQLEFHNTFCRKDINNKTKSDKKNLPGPNMYDEAGKIIPVYRQKS